MAYLSFTIRSRELGSNAELVVLLPEGAERGDTERNYQVLWMLHGANQDCTEWVRQTSIERYVQKYNLAVVMPSTYNGFYMDMKYGARYFSFLTKELPQMIHYLFPCFSQKREDNFIAGASMGGYGAFKWAMNYPEMFCSAGSFAGSIDMVTIMKRYLLGIQPGGPDLLHAFGNPEEFENTRDDVLYMAKKNVDNKVNIPNLYMVCGTEDFGYDLNVSARDSLIASGIPIEWKQGPGAHSHDFWDGYLPDFLGWLPTRVSLKKQGGER